MKRPDLTPKTLTNYSKATKAEELPDAHWRVSKPYTCPELRPFTGRPGAMDAYKLPSLMGANLVPGRHADRAA